MSFPLAYLTLANYKCQVQGRVHISTVNYLATDRAKIANGKK